jgi:hypothetical protein
MTLTTHSSLSVSASSFRISFEAQELQRPVVTKCDHVRELVGLGLSVGLGLPQALQSPCELESASVGHVSRHMNLLGI